MQLTQNHILALYGKDRRRAIKQSFIAKMIGTSVILWAGVIAWAQN